MRRITNFLFVMLLVFAPMAGARAESKNAPSVLAPGQLPEVNPIVTEYSVFIGGVHLLDARFLFQQEKSRYHVTAHVKTQGFWGWMFPWKADLVSDGSIRDARFLPLVHKNTSTWKEEEKTVWMRFDNQRNVTTEFVPHEGPDKNREIVTAEQSRGSLDPLSAILQLLGDLAVSQSCAVTEPAFDGKRRFDLAGEDKGWSVTDHQGYGIYKGKARRCDVYFKMIAGKWLDREHSLFWQYMDGDKGRNPFRIWLAALSPELPELAVRVESPSVWGRIVIHLKEWRYVRSDEIKS